MIRIDFQGCINVENRLELKDINHVIHWNCGFGEFFRGVPQSGEEHH
ncbi:MAG TPA: hypothetical protein VK642_11830 [Burkholderiales bacterium]|nr:hypothetical protein [Burkholderiales bacterium]